MSKSILGLIIMSAEEAATSLSGRGSMVVSPILFVGSFKSFFIPCPNENGSCVNIAVNSAGNGYPFYPVTTIPKGKTATTLGVTQ